MTQYDSNKLRPSHSVTEDVDITTKYNKIWPQLQL